MGKKKKKRKIVASEKAKTKNKTWLYHIKPFILGLWQVEYKAKETGVVLWAHPTTK